jgi:hypothetical protein
VVSSITVSALPVITINSGTICSGYSITLVPGGASTYTISNSGGTVATVVSPSTTANYSVIGTSAAGCISNTTTPAVSTIQVNNSPTIAATSNTVCVGSVVSLSLSGANTYSLNGVSTSTAGTVSPTSNTTYTVTGTGTNACVSPTSNIAIATVTVYALPNVQATSSSSAICIGQGTAVLTATGASTYSWSNASTTASTAVSPASSTVYAVVGTNSLGCVNIATIALTVNSLPVINIANSNTFICVGGSSTLTASGANTYTWSNATTGANTTVSPIVNANYTCVGTDANGCVSSKTAAVQVNSNVLTATPNNSICLGSSAILSASGAVTYTWNNNFAFQTFSPTPLVATVYTVTGLDASNCLLSNTVSVGVWQLPVISVAQSHTKICINESATLTVSGTQSYLWSTGAMVDNIVVSSPTAAANVYTVTGTDSNSCTATKTATLVIDNCVGLQSINKNAIQISVYPNPNNGVFVIDMNFEGNKTIEVYNISGQLILSKYINTLNQEINLIDYAKGIYYVKVSNGAGIEKRLKVSVE